MDPSEMTTLIGGRWKRRKAWSRPVLIGPFAYEFLDSRCRDFLASGFRIKWLAVYGRNWKRNPARGFSSRREFFVSGAMSGVATPLPIPNREVKHSSGDGSAIFGWCKSSPVPGTKHLPPREQRCVLLIAAQSFHKVVVAPDRAGVEVAGVFIIGAVEEKGAVWCSLRKIRW